MLRTAFLSCLFSSLALPAPVARPRLGVLIVIDQLSAQTFESRAASLTGGIKRMVDEGVRFRECRYEAAPTVTSTGHSTLVTGAYGETHGIVSNEWFDHDTGKPVLSTEDPAYQVLGRPPLRDGTAPTWLRASTLGDSIKLADERGKVVAISAKDRAAILSAGRSADAAIWFDGVKPFFTTSTFYAKEIPPWVMPVNEAIAKMVLQGAFAWGLPNGGITGANPEPPPRGGDDDRWVDRTELQPILDTFEVDLAVSAVKAMALGKDDAADLLVVSFSGHDRTGHHFGPDSPESISEFAVIDREIGRLLQTLDAEVGKGKYVVALTSDHGVTPLPELTLARHIDGGRVDMIGLRDALEQEAVAALGKGPWFAALKSPGLYARPETRLKLHTIDERLRTAARKRLGIIDLLPLPAVLAGALGANAFADLYRRGAVDSRSPDFIVLTKPFWNTGGPGGTGHGTAYLYDRAVPLIFFGGPIKRATGGDVEAIDVAPTLARLLSVPPPASARGHALELVVH